MNQARQPIDVAVLGATGAVGQRFIQLLEGHPWFRVAEVIASDRSAGQLYGKVARWVLPGNPPEDVVGREVLPLDADVQSRIVFSALPADIAKTVEWRLAEAGQAAEAGARRRAVQARPPGGRSGPAAMAIPRRRSDPSFV